MKKAVNKRRILFLFSMSSENPFSKSKALSTFGVIVSPFPLINCKEKSRTIQQNEGKYWLNSSETTS